jgi:alpha-L-fucosidase
MNPAFEDEKPINPFDFWKGANFKLKIRKVDGYWNYDKSEFESVTQIAEDDNAIKAVWGKQHALKPFVDPSNFKSYDELKEKLIRVISGTQNTETVEKTDLPPKTNGTVKSQEVKSSPTSDNDEDDTLSYFSKLADED